MTQPAILLEVSWHHECIVGEDGDMHTDTLYDYSFTVWPDEQSPRWNPAAYKLFEMFACRVVMEFSAKQFGDFREEVAKVGLTLREIERSPHFEPEPVL